MIRRKSFVGSKPRIFLSRWHIPLRILSILAFMVLASACDVGRSQGDFSVDGCQLSDSLCLVDNDNSVHIALDNQHIVPLQLFEVRIQDPKQKIATIRATIVGMDMDMGFIPVSFKKAGNTLWLAKTSVGVCSVDQQMKWALDVRIQLVGGENIARKFGLPSMAH